MMQTILIIDDDAAIGNLEQEVLERAGYAVQRAYSGTEALLLLKSSRPDLILLDLMLPGLSGEEVLPRIQGIPVIVRRNGKNCRTDGQRIKTVRRTDFFF